MFKSQVLVAWDLLINQSENYIIKSSITNNIVEHF